MKKIDKVIKIIRENMVANAPGTEGGFGSSASSKGPFSGFDPVITPPLRKKYATGGKDSRKWWIQYLRNKNK